MDVRETYISVCKALISSSRSLEILSFPASKGQSLYDLPFWVPHWDNSELCRYPFSTTKDHNSLTPSADNLRIFSASQDSSVDAKFYKNGAIGLQGYTFDRIVDTARAFHIDEHIAEQVVSWGTSKALKVSHGLYHPSVFTSVNHVFSYMRSLAEIIEEWQSFSKSAEPDRFEIFATTLWTDLSSENAADECREWLSKWHHMRSVLDSLPLFEGEPTNENTHKWIVAALPSLSRLGPEDISLKQNPQCLHILGRRLAWTRSGKLCLLPSDAEIGDDLCLLRGSTTPHVVRRSDGGFQHVGEAFVHGVMYGEIWREADCHEIYLI